jgi:hypothetical protein
LDDSSLSKCSQRRNKNLNMIKTQDDYINYRLESVKRTLAFFFTTDYTD